MFVSIVMQELESRHIKQRSDNEAQLNSLSTDSDSETSNRPDAGGGSSSGDKFIVTAEDRAQQHASGNPSGRIKSTNLVNGSRWGLEMHTIGLQLHAPAEKRNNIVLTTSAVLTSVRVSVRYAIAVSISACSTGYCWRIFK